MLEILKLLSNSKFFWIAAVLAGIYAYLKFFFYAYWKRQGVPHETPIIPFGNMLSVVTGKTYFGYFIRESYKKFRHRRFYGMYVLHRAVLVVNDSKIIDEILIKQFDKFNGRGIYQDPVDPLTLNLFNLSGDRWKKLRTKLSPTFTPRKLKEMFPLIKEISNELVKACDSAIVKNDVFEMKDLMSRYTTDIITSIVYGKDCKSLCDPENEFKRYGHMAFDASPMLMLFTVFHPIVLIILRITYFPKEMTQFFAKSFRDAVKYRRQIEATGKDFLSLLIKLMDDGMLDNKDDADNQDVVDITHKLSISEAQAQAFVFFLGGFETSSSVMTYLLYEMALNHEIQGKAHEEVDKFLMKGELTYERIQSELRYIDMVISETMRKYPTFLVLNRICNTDWKIPDSDYIIKKGTSIIIPTFGLNHDPEIYPDPEKFDPDRFSNDANGSTHSSCAYLPFGSGPKYCIGTRLAMLQLKLGLVALFSNYKFSKCEKTPVTMQYSNRSFTLSPGCGVYLRMEKRTEKR